MEPAVSDPSRRITAERIVLLAWPRAILLQLAHPLIAAGVAGHSTFRGDAGAALGRLRQTIDAMLAITFGGDAAREHALDGIRAIHRRVHGTLAAGTGPFAAGTPYSAEDPALLLWVAATLAESTVLIYEQLVAPMTETERDRYCADSADVAIALGARADEVPRTWHALASYSQAQYAGGSIVVGQDARTLAESLLAPFGGPIGRRIVTPLLSLVAAGQLPPQIRRAYGLAWGRGFERRFRALLTVLRWTRRLLPRSIATWAASRRPVNFGASHAKPAAAR